MTEKERLKRIKEIKAELKRRDIDEYQTKPQFLLAGEPKSIRELNEMRQSGQIPEEEYQKAILGNDYTKRPEGIEFLGMELSPESTETYKAIFPRQYEAKQRGDGVGEALGAYADMSSLLGRGGAAMADMVSEALVGDEKFNSPADAFKFMERSMQKTEGGNVLSDIVRAPGLVESMGVGGVLGRALLPARTAGAGAVAAETGTQAGAKVLPKAIEVLKAGGKRAAVGGGSGGTSAVINQASDISKGQDLSTGEVGLETGLGAGIDVGLGAAGAFGRAAAPVVKGNVKNVLQKLSGYSGEAIEEVGPARFQQVKDILKGNKDGEGIKEINRIQNAQKRIDQRKQEFDKIQDKIKNEAQTLQLKIIKAGDNLSKADAEEEKLYKKLQESYDESLKNYNSDMQEIPAMAGDDFSQKIANKFEYIPEKKQVEKVLSEMDESGVEIDINPVLDRLKDMRSTAEARGTRVDKRFIRDIDDMEKVINFAAPEGSISPSQLFDVRKQLDNAINYKSLLSGKVTNSGVELNRNIANDFRSLLRNKASEIGRQDYLDLMESYADRLSKIDNIGNMFSGSGEKLSKTVEKRLRNYNKMSQAEKRAVKDFDDIFGTSYTKDLSQPAPVKPPDRTPKAELKESEALEQLKRKSVMSKFDDKVGKPEELPGYEDITQASLEYAQKLKDATSPDATATIQGMVGSIPVPATQALAQTLYGAGKAARAPQLPEVPNALRRYIAPDFNPDELFGILPYPGSRSPIQRSDITRAARSTTIQDIIGE